MTAHYNTWAKTINYRILSLYDFNFPLTPLIKCCHPQRASKLSQSKTICDPFGWKVACKMNFEIISRTYIYMMMFTWIDNRFLSSQFQKFLINVIHLEWLMSDLYRTSGSCSSRFKPMYPWNLICKQTSVAKRADIL